MVANGSLCWIVNQACSNCVGAFTLLNAVHQHCLNLACHPRQQAPDLRCGCRRSVPSCWRNPTWPKCSPRFDGIQTPTTTSRSGCCCRRFAPKLLENPHLAKVQGASAVFLDTTYCNPRHTFPPQVHLTWVNMT